MTRNRFLSSTCGALFALAAITGCGDDVGNGDSNTPGRTETPGQSPQTPAPSPSEQTPGAQTPGTQEPGDADTSPDDEPIATTPPGGPSTTPEAPSTDEPEQPVQADTDKFGVTMLHPTLSGGEQWFLADDATSDSRFDPKEDITRNSDGSWNIKSSKVRMSVFTSTGYKPNEIATYDREVLASRGYMQSPNDWKNVEMTGFMKLNGASDESDNFDLYARGGRHNDDNEGCEGSSYKGALHFDGRARFQKETWHVSYEPGPYKEATEPLMGRWVGFKAVMRNTQVNGEEAVHLELYLNDNADKVSWEKVYDFVDAGDWGGDAEHCGGAVGAMPITWGGPIATFRWDSTEDVDFKWLSVREIAPEQP
ncbi:carbohydrate-binding protein [Corallococcus macrosporus]|uniref:carbohydrate-binding protein n=1 Tax=Corallococcus macrosporus TaxID=35 RepID=UPI0003179DAA|nr:carbohydrate-binding protein [Corallococcus macrosporus]